MASRKAGQLLEGNSSTQSIARKAVQDASEMFGFDAPQPQYIGSHHVDLGSGQVGVINDGDPTSTIYNNGKKVQGEFEKYRNPLQGQPYGTQELRQMTPMEYEKYEEIFNRNVQHGTGNLV